MGFQPMKEYLGLNATKMKKPKCCYIIGNIAVSLYHFRRQSVLIHRRLQMRVRLSVGVAHRAVVHIARLHFLHLVVVLEMPHSTEDVDDFRVHLMCVVPDVRTWSQAAHHDFVFLVNEVSCVQFTISSLEVLYSLLFDVVVVDDHSICQDGCTV